MNFIYELNNNDLAIPVSSGEPFLTWQVDTLFHYNFTSCTVYIDPIYNFDIMS